MSRKKNFTMYFLKNVQLHLGEDERANFTPEAKNEKKKSKIIPISRLFQVSRF